MEMLPVGALILQGSAAIVDFQSQDRSCCMCHSLSPDRSMVGGVSSVSSDTCVICFLEMPVFVVDDIGSLFRYFLWFSKRVKFILLSLFRICRLLFSDILELRTMS